MIRTLLPCLLSAVLAVILRDLACFAAAKIFCWRKRRQTQREAQKKREVRHLAADLVAAEKDELVRISQEADAVPYPRLLRGPRVITIRNDKDFLLVNKCLHANFRAQGKPIVNADFEEN